ncbi:hypothetical protein EMCRGX_G015676 [Ephydatia muelleri]
MSLLKYTILAICLLCGHVSNAACPSFNINYPPMRTLLCPGDIITYTCAISTTTFTAVTWWSGSGFTCPANSPSNTIQLTQPTGAGASLNTVPVSCGNLSAVMTNISGTCYTSVLTIPTPQYFNGTTVTCRDGNFGTLIGSDTLNIQLASVPSAPTITSLISTYPDRLTVTWTSVPTATSYNVFINDSVNTLVPIPSTGAPQYTFTGLTSNTVYTVSVVAINCVGSSSALASIRTAATVVQPSSSTVPISTSQTSQAPTVATTTTPQPTIKGSGVREAAGVSIVIAMTMVLLMLMLNQLTVTWTSVPTATSYNVSINDSVNTLVPIPSTGAPQYTFTGLTNNTAYTVSVVVINCAGSSSTLASNSTSRLGFDLAPNEMQWSIKWWLGLPLTPEVGVCAYCPDKALDAHHAVTCKFGGDVVARHNTLRDAIYDFCKRALLNPKLEAGAGLGHERRLTRPADILIPSWSTSDKPAAIDVSITSPLKSSILSEAGVVAGAAARQTKHSNNDSICSELGWKCVPLVVETFGAWGKTAGQFFGQLAVRLAAQGNSTKATTLNSIYGRLSLLLVRANARAFIARSISEATTMDLLEG